MTPFPTMALPSPDMMNNNDKYPPSSSSASSDLHISRRRRSIAHPSPLHLSAHGATAHPRCSSQTPKATARRRLDSDASMRSQPCASALDDRLTYTPTTHRISRAKKGKRVHACSDCSKIFTRAEHLKRHRMNHNSEAQHRCDADGCTKAFHREDLLKRHKERQ